MAHAEQNQHSTTAHTEVPAGAHAADAHHAGPFYLDPAFWVAIAFVVFVVAAAKPIAKALVNTLDARTDKIRKQLLEAAKLKAEAEATLATYKKKQKEVVTEAKDIIEGAKRQAENLQKQAQKNLEDMLNRRERQALNRIAQAESQAVNEVRNLAVDIAVAATRQLLQDKLTPEEVEELVDKSMDAVSGKIH